MGPPDAIIGLTEAYKEDMFEHKVNVGVGAYRSDEGAPYVLPCVREAESILMGQNLEHEYSGIVSRLYSMEKCLMGFGRASMFFQPEFFVSEIKALSLQ